MGLINSGNIHLFCNTNAALVKGAPKALVLEFPGLGGGSCLGGVTDFCEYDNIYTRRFAEHGILAAYLFSGPWSWGNKAAVRIADAVVIAICEKYDMADIPTVVCGGSMGGLGALIYCADGKANVVACAAACPCVDAVGSFYALPEFSRTMLSAVAGYDMPFEQGLESISPLHRLPEMPDIPYRIVCDGDDALFPPCKITEYAQKLQNGIKNKVDLIYLAGLGHGGFTDAEREGFHSFIVKNCIKKE